MKKYFFQIILIFSICQASFGQLIPPSLKILAASNETNSFVSTLGTNDKVPGLTEKLPGYHQINIVKMKGEVFACVPFTGQLYRMKNENQNLKWERVDSTFIVGYNLNCLHFCVDSIIYSFGGSGIWQVTGHLRYYSPQKYEWEIIRLNREIPFILGEKNAFWIDGKYKKLYLIAKEYDLPAFKRDENRFKDIKHRTWVLDLNTNDWTSLGASPDTSFLITANSPWGAFCMDNNTPTIVDFVNNRYLKASPDCEKKMAPFFRAKAKYIYFFRDSTLFFGDFSNYVDSVKFRKSDFIDTGIPVYSTNEKPFYLNYRYYIGLFILGLIILTIIYKLRNRETIRKKEENSFPSDTERTIEQLEESELAVIKLIFNQSVNQQTTSIDELNSVMGLNRKNTDIQKKQRSDMILSINRKISLLTNQKEPAIDKQRSDFDKRSFVYFIPVQRISEVQNLLKESTTEK